MRWLARLLAGIAFFYVFGAMLLTVTAPRDLIRGRHFSSAFYDRQGRLLRLELTPDQKYRVWVPLAGLSPKLIDATLSLEDRFFYVHPGINPVALGRAMVSLAWSGHASAGASTITMQLARLRYGLRTRTVSGKLRQMVRALQLEWVYSKDEILEAYLNLAPYGGNIEGAGAASEIYFEKRAKSLTEGEALMLSVLPQSPSQRAPARATAPAGPKSLVTARDRLLKRYLAEHPAEDSELMKILLQRSLRKPSELPWRAPHFVDGLVASEQPVGEVQTTLDLNLQGLIERRLRAYVESRKGQGVHNGAAMLLDWRSMEVLALVGSVNFRDPAIQGQVNGTKAKRSPGSTLKPFIYGLALDQGIIHTLSLLKDAPTSFGEWRPENFDQDFAGPIKVHDALIRSRNVPAIQVAAQLKTPTLYDFLKHAGVTRLREEEHYGLALVLGGAEMTMEELVRLYAMLANGGRLKPIQRLQAPTSRLDEGEAVLSPEAAYLVLDILKDNPRPNSGYQRQWVAGAVDVAWKTGTSYSFRDAWAIGVVGPYVLATWIGNFDGEGNPAFTGVDMAGPLFFELIDALKARGLPTVPVPKRQLNIKSVEVCALSGRIPGPYCQARLHGQFIPGKSPIQVCDIHRPVNIDVRTGMRSCAAEPGTSRQEVYEFWDSDFLKLFRQAGVPRRTPPPWLPGCAQGPKADLGLAPRITSPRANIVYNVRLNGPGTDRLPLTAVTDADGGAVYWFLDHAFLGAATGGKPFYWTPRPGTFLVQAVDSQGRGATSRVQVAVLE